MEIHVIQKSGWAGDILVVPVLAPETEEPGKPGKEVGDAILVEKDGSRSLLVSLGPESKLAADSFRRAGGAAARWLRKNRVRRAGVDADVLRSYGIDGSVQAFCEGLLLGAFRFLNHKSENTGIPESRMEFLVEEGAAEVEDL